MITVLFIILIIVSAVSITAGLFLISEDRALVSSLLLFIGIVIAIISIAYFENSKLLKSPTKQDVLDSKAIYQETQIITGNDTIKTYNIVWKQKN